jgi:hypothetical protein
MTTITKTLKLWELADEMTELETAIADLEETEDLTEQERENLLAQWFENWLDTNGEFDKKAENVACYIKHLEAITEARKNEYHRLRTLAEQSEKAGDRLREYLTKNCLKAGKTSIKGLKANLSIRKKPARVILNCEPEELPPELKKVETTARLNKIKEYLKDHPDCDFAMLSILEEFSLTIR